MGRAKLNNATIRWRAGCITLILLVGISVLCVAAAEPAATHTKTQVLVYLVGSDLESLHNAGTTDLLGMVDAYGSCDPKNLDIVVAFGGARKNGWRGMKVASMEQLAQDAKDRKFGNAKKYLLSDPKADMGSGAAFSQFLSTAREFGTSDRTILIISDHGGSYSGIGVDETTGNILSISDIDSVLQKQGITFDPVIFDACLMGSVEVAKTMKSHTVLMLGSEDIQYGSYDYSRVIGPLVDNPAIDSKSLGQKIADAYIGRSSGDALSKTSSIIDASQLPAIKESLGKLGARLGVIMQTEEGLHDIKSAYNHAVPIGVVEGDVGTSIDLASLLTNIEKKRPEVSPEVQKTIALIKKAVVYEKHTRYSQDVCGISIASPDAMTLQQYDTYGETVKIAPSWDEIFVKMVSESQYNENANGQRETETAADMGPYKSGESTGNEPADAPGLLSPAFIRRQAGEYELVDRYEGASIFAGYYLVRGTDLLSIGTRPIVKGSNGYYKIPEWDGQWYYFTAAPLSAPPFLVDLKYSGKTVGGHDTYHSWISLTDGGVRTNASVKSFMTGTTGAADVVINPCYTTGDGATAFGAGMKQFESGVRVSSYSDGYNTVSKKTRDLTLSEMTTVPNMGLRYQILPDGTYAAGIIAYYDNDNMVLTDQMRIVTIRNGAVVKNGIGPITPA